MVLPAITLWYISIASSWVFPTLFQGSVTTTHWTKGLGHTGNFGVTLMTSLFLSASLALVVTTAALTLSYSLMSRYRGQKLVSLGIIPYAIAPIVLGSIIRYYFMRLGIAGTTLGVWVGQLVYILPYAVLLFIPFWTKGVLEMLDQARMLGAGDLQLFRSIIIPGGKWWLLLVYLQSFLVSWFDYGMTQSIGLGKVKTLMTLAMRYIREADPHLSAVSASLVSIPAIGFMLMIWVIFKTKKMVQ